MSLKTVVRFMQYLSLLLVLRPYGIVFTTLIFPYTDISLDDQMFSILLRGRVLSIKQALFGCELFVIRKINSQGVDRFFWEQFSNWASKLKRLFRLNVSKKNSVIISVLRKFYCVCVIYFDAFYIIYTRQRTALPDFPSQIKLLSGKSIV